VGRRSADFRSHTNEEEAVYEVNLADGATLRVLLGADESPDDADNVDVWIRMPDGVEWSASVITIDALAERMRHWSEWGETPGGACFPPHTDTVIVRDRGVDHMAGVFREMIARGGPAGFLPGPSDPDEDLG
jgi:hypothetical protein